MQLRYIKFLNSSIRIVPKLQPNGELRHRAICLRIAIAVNPSQNYTVRLSRRVHVRIVCLSRHSFLHASVVRRYAFPIFDFHFRRTFALLRLHL